MRRQSQQADARQAFTLIELILVIAIIGVLAALSAGAIFRVMAAQALRRSETTVSKVQSALDLQWQAVIDNVKDELHANGVPPAVLGLAGGNTDRARILYLKLRIKQEFPMNFTEVVTGIPVFGQPYQPPQKSAFLTAISGASAGSPQDESAALLFLSLSQSRRGQNFTPDDVGANAIQSRYFGNVSLRVFVDSSGSSITLERYTNDATLLSELNAPPYVNTRSVYYDPDDPMGLLTSNWSQKPTAQNYFGYTFNNLSSAAPKNLNRGPIIRSPGPDKVYDTADDILGFRLTKAGQRGN